jgi:hypothetical protein
MLAMSAPSVVSVIDHHGFRAVGMGAAVGGRVETTFSVGVPVGGGRDVAGSRVGLPVADGWAGAWG